MTYLDLLEKAFAIFRLQPYRKNFKTKIGTGQKIYFYNTEI